MNVIGEKGQVDGQRDELERQQQQSAHAQVDEILGQNQLKMGARTSSYMNQNRQYEGPKIER